LDDEKFVQALSSLNEAKLFHLFDLFVTNEQNFVCNDDDTKRLDIRKLTDACHVWTLDTTSVVKIEERELALCMLKQPGPDQQQLARTLESHRYELEVRPTVRIVRSAQLASACQRSYSESTFATTKKSTIDSNYIDTLTRALASPASRVGKECFLGRLPDYMYEDELLELLEPFGPIVELQLHIDPRKGASRGYAFVSFSTKEKAQEAIKHLDEYAVRGTHEIVVSYGEQRKSLYVGNVPGTVHKEQLFQYLRQILRKF
jgi:hypothetical protein